MHGWPDSATVNTVTAQSLAIVLAAEGPATSNASRPEKSKVTSRRLVLVGEHQPPQSGCGSFLLGTGYEETYS